MHRTTVASIAVAATLAGCGSSGGSSTVSAHHLARPSHVYRVTMSPPAGAHKSTASGVAIIALHTTPGDLCWRFAHLHGFTEARSGVVIASGTVIHLSTSSKLHHQGCRRLTAGLLASIARNPGRYSVAIPTASAPRGALSARL